MCERSFDDLGSLPAVASAFPKAAVQRAGWLLQLMAHETGTEASTADALDELSHMAGPEWAALVPGQPATGTRDQRWRVVVNAAVEHDL